MCTEEGSPSTLGTCTEPIDLNLEGGTYQANTADYQDEFALQLFGQCNHNKGTGEVVFSYVPTENGMLVASTVFPETTSDTVVGILNVCNKDAQFKSCNGDVSNLDPRAHTRWHAIAGLPIWIVVDARPEGQFKLEVRVEPYAKEGDACSNLGVDEEIPTLPLCSEGLTCADNVCIDPTCESAGDGRCDEPKGTGLCLGGTDSSDCGPCPANSAYDSSGFCTCDTGFEMVAGTCEPLTCGFDSSCPGTTDCTWNFKHDELRCSTLEGEANLGEQCMDEDFIDPFWGCGPFQVCHWASCNTTTVCHRVCKTKADCGGQFSCGVGVCSIFPGNTYGYCK